ALESPGAIAELGLFSALEEFQEKLLIFVDNAHYQADSFIRLGPIQYLENRFQNNAHCHRFLVNGRAFDASAAEELQSEMVQAITVNRTGNRGGCLVKVKQVPQPVL